MPLADALEITAESFSGVDFARNGKIDGARSLPEPSPPWHSTQRDS